MALCALAALWIGFGPAVVGETAGLPVPRTGTRIALTRDGASRLFGWSPDSRWLLYVQMPGRRVAPGGRLWTVSADGRTRHPIGSDSVQDAAFLRDGQHIIAERLVGDPKNPVLIFTDRSGRFRRVYHFSQQIILQRAIWGRELTPQISLGVLPSGHLMFDRNGVISDFNPLSGHVTRVSAHRVSIPGNGTSAWVAQAAISPSGRLLAETDGTIRDVRTGRVVRRIAGDKFCVQLAWSPDSRQLAYESRSRIQTIDVSSGRQHTVLKLPAMEFVNNLVWSPHGRLLSLVDTQLAAGADVAARILFLDPRRAAVWPMDEGTLPAFPGEMEYLWAPSGEAIGYVRSSRGRNQALRLDAYVAKLTGPPE